MKKMYVIYLALWFIVTILFPCKVNATIYYDIDFSSPLHTIGQAPTTGSSIYTPSEIVSGQPVVSQSLGALQDQPLVFNTLGNSPFFYYDQIQLNMNRGTGFYYTSFDILTQSLMGSRNHFVVLFDTPCVHNITFQNDGTINLFGKKQINYLENQLMHFEVLMNVAQKQASIILNGNEVFDGALWESSACPVKYLRAIRFSLGLVSGIDSSDSQTYVGIDNIHATDYVIPEPATLSLLALGAFLAGRRRK